MQILHITYLGILGIMGSVVLTLVSNSFFSVWIALELNLLSIMAFFTISLEKGNVSVLKYFLVQAFSSSLFLSALVFFSMNSKIFIMLIMISMSLKMAVAPFHGWFIVISNEVSWNMFFWLASVQKIIPLYILYQFFHWLGEMVIIVTIITGIWGSMNLIMAKSFMAYSSVYSSAWLLSAHIYWEAGLCYWIIYSFSMFVVVVSFISQEWMYSFNFNFFEIWEGTFNSWLGLLSMGGMPPLIGFFAKVYILKMLLFFSKLFLSLILVVSSVFLLFLYLRSIMLSFLNSPSGIRLVKQNISGNYWLSLSVLTFPSLIIL